MRHNESNLFYFKGVKINDVNFEEVLYIINQNLDNKAYICLTEVTILISALKDNELKHSINQSLLSLADGMPLQWYGNLIGNKKVERITGFRLMKHLLEQKNDLKHFLLGDTDETQLKVIEKAKSVNRHLKINSYSPPFKNQFSYEDNQLIFNEINNYSPDIIWVSFGGKKQENWMKQNIHFLNKGLMIGVGAAFKFYIGNLKIVSKKIQNLGLQWTTRLFDSPKHFITGGPLMNRLQFIYYLPSELIKNRK